MEDRINERLAKLESDHLAQEHRMVKVASNILDYGFDSSNPDKRKASWSAVIGFLFRQARITLVIAISSGVVALSSLYLAWKSNNIIEKQNQLITVQNERVRQQAYLMDSELKRPTPLEVIELEALIDSSISKDGHMSVNAIAKLSSKLFSFQPYYYLDGEEDLLNSKPYSKEKSRVLIKLIESKLNSSSWGNLGRRVNFDRIDIANTIFPELVDFSNFKMNASNFHDSKFRFSKFHSARLNNSDFTDAFLESVNFISAFAPNCDFSNSDLRDVDFSKSALNNSVFVGADIYSCTLDSAVFSGVDFRGADIYNISAIGADFKGAKIYEEQRLSLELSDLTRAQLDQFIWEIKTDN